MNNDKPEGMPTARHVLFALTMFVLFSLASYALIDWVGKRHDDDKKEQMVACTYGGTDRTLATRYVNARDKVQLDFQNCLRGNGNGNVELCESVAYGISNLEPLPKNSTGDYMRDVITSVEMCNHDVR